MHEVCLCVRCDPCKMGPEVLRYPEDEACTALRFCMIVIEASGHSIWMQFQCPIDTLRVGDSSASILLCWFLRSQKLRASSELNTIDKVLGP